MSNYHEDIGVEIFLVAYNPPRLSAEVTEYLREREASMVNPNEPMGQYTIEKLEEAVDAVGTDEDARLLAALKEKGVDYIEV